MLSGFFVLIACQLLGEGAGELFHLPIPGPVTGMLLLTAALVLRGSGKATAIGDSLEQTAGTLIRHMGLLFVPAGVGVIAQAAVLRAAWLPLSVGLLGSTVLSLIVTGLVMHWMSILRDRPSSAPAWARGQ